MRGLWINRNVSFWGWLNAARDFDTPPLTKHRWTLMCCHPLTCTKPTNHKHHFRSSPGYQSNTSGNRVDTELSPASRCCALCQVHRARRKAPATYPIRSYSQPLDLYTRRNIDLTQGVGFRDIDMTPVMENQMENGK